MGQAWTERNLKARAPNQAGVIRGALAERTIQSFEGLRGTESSYVTQASLELQILSPLSAGITSICYRSWLLQSFKAVHKDQEKCIAIPYPMELWNGQDHQERKPGPGSETTVKQGQINVSFPGTPRIMPKALSAQTLWADHVTHAR